MPLYDYECSGCGEESEKQALIDRRHEQVCDLCSCPLTLVQRPTRHYRPFHNYFDMGLGVEITGREHRRRVMRGLSMDFKDHPSAGDESARLDKEADKEKKMTRGR